MPSTHSFKRKVRAPMAETGEKYTVARWALLAEAAMNEPLDPVIHALRPGPMIGVVSEFALTNLGFVLPHLIRLHEKGHRLSAVSHDQGGRGGADLGPPFLRFRCGVRLCERRGDRDDG